MLWCTLPVPDSIIPPLTVKIKIKSLLQYFLIDLNNNQKKQRELYFLSCLIFVMVDAFRRDRLN